MIGVTSDIQLNHFMAIHLPRRACKDFGHTQRIQSSASCRVGEAQLRTQVELLEIFGTN